MSYFSGALYSETLNMDTSVAVILPQDSRWHRGIIPLAPGIEPRKKTKTLLLLHGLTDNWVAWAHRSRIYSFAEYYDIAVVMPEVQRSFYQDMKNGMHYFTYITEELPKLVSELFQVSVEPEDLMIAGLSMGGYGALKCGLTYPERYSAVGAFSSACDMEGFVTHIPVRKETVGFDRDVAGMFGENLNIPDMSRLKHLTDLCSQNICKASNVEGSEEDAKGKFPKIYMACGRQDELFEQNIELRDCMIAKGLPHTWEEWDGIHDWDFWDVAIQSFLKLALTE